MCAPYFSKAHWRKREIICSKERDNPKKICIFVSVNHAMVVWSPVGEKPAAPRKILHHTQPPRMAVVRKESSTPAIHYI